MMCAEISSVLIKRKQERAKVWKGESFFQARSDRGERKSNVWFDYESVGLQGKNKMDYQLTGALGELWCSTSHFTAIQQNIFECSTANIEDKWSTGNRSEKDVELTPLSFFCFLYMMPLGYSEYVNQGWEPAVLVRHTGSHTVISVIVEYIACNLMEA